MFEIRTIAEQTKLPHVKMFLITEIIAKSIKKIYEYSMTQLIWSAGQVEDSTNQNFASETEFEAYRRELMADFEEAPRKLTVEVLNWALEDTQAGNMFWENYVKPQCQISYNFKFKPNFSRQQIPRGMLINALKFHLNVTLVDRPYDETLSLADAGHYFSRTDVLEFEFRTRHYSYKKHVVRAYCNNYIQYRENRNLMQASRLLEIEMKICEALANHHRLRTLGVELADLHYQMNELDKAVLLCRKGITKYGSYSPTNLKYLFVLFKVWIAMHKQKQIESTFNLTRGMLSYMFSDDHPLHSTLCSFLA